MSNKLIPNTFQHPNAYIDWLSHYLTPQEEKVLGKAIREILGWHDKIESRRAKIALSIFTDGKKDRNGKTLCLGCGLSTGAVRAALTALNEFNILCKIGGPTQDGQEFYLQENWDAIDFDGLEERLSKKSKGNAQRTVAARQAKGLLSDNTQVCSGTTPKSVVGQQQRNPIRNPVETQEPTAVVSFDGLGTAQKNNQTIPDHYVEVQVSNLVNFFRCPECNGEQPWPSQESKRKKPQTLICRGANCGVYFLIENEATGKKYSIPIPEPEWVLRFDAPFGALKRLVLTEREFKTFRRNWKEDCGLVVEKIQWAATQDWLVYQRGKVAGRVNAAYETAKKTRVQTTAQPAPPKKVQNMPSSAVTFSQPS